MNKFKYYFILFVTTLSLFSCSKNSVTSEPLRDYSVQYTTDIATIEEYLKTTYITVTNHPGFTDDQDVVFTKIPDGGTQPSIMSYLNNAGFPKLLSRDVNFHGITYKLYYMVLREGVGSKPCNVDYVLASYRGDYLTQVAATSATAASLTATQFEESKYPQSFFLLEKGSAYGTIPGWGEIFPQFKTGNYASASDGTVSYSDFGAGIMFIPSGLAYFERAQGSIPSYSPLVFSFKLFEIKRSDQDLDGIYSYQEDIDGDGYLNDYRNTTFYPVTPATNPDDTDADGIANFYDVDDDGDNYTTKLEIKNPITGLPYPFNEIPTCTTGKKNYLDSSCHPK